MYFILGKPTVWPFLNAVIFRASTHLMNPSDPDTCRILQSRKEASERDFLAKKKKRKQHYFFQKKFYENSKHFTLSIPKNNILSHTKKAISRSRSL